MTLAKEKNSVSRVEVCSALRALTYEAVELVESGQHVAGSVMCSVQSDHVRVAEIVGFIIVQVHIASCIYIGQGQL